jgi:ATP/maltotriose-dependent transcriptional regulator MalT
LLGKHSVVQSHRLMRTRLHDRLARATAFPITLIVAPAGFGKSTVLRDFLVTAGEPALRFDVRREDDTLFGFARSLSEVLEPVAPSARATFPAAQQRMIESANPARDIGDWFVEHLGQSECTVVIDDLHHAYADRATIAFLSNLIDRTYERVSWIVASRSESELPVGSWLAYGRMDVPIDENDLRFTREEALAVAEEMQSRTEIDEIDSLFELTGGWPVALAIALRTRTYATDLRAATSGAREMVYRYLAEQVFTGLTLEQQQFLLATSVFSRFDAGMAQDRGGTATFIAELRRGVAFLSEVAPGEYRYHDLFRSFLETELRRRGDDEWRAALRDGAAILERRGDAADALRLFTRARDIDGIVATIERHGFRLFERGHIEVLSFALDALDERTANERAAVLGLRAMLDAAHGHFDIAQREFTRAIGFARDDEVHFALVHRYALELIRNELDCIDLLEPRATNPRVPPAQRAQLLATLATGYARADRASDALAAMHTALDLAECLPENDVRARIYQQAAFVYLVEANRTRARIYAERAVEASLSQSLYDLAVRAYSVLFQIASEESDDPVDALSILERLIECARKGAGTQARLYGLMASAWIEAERGNDGALDEIDAELHAIGTSLPRLESETLIPAAALRAAWAGEFARACEYLRGTAERCTGDDRRAYRYAELAFYAFAAGFGEEGESALADAMSALARWSRPTPRALSVRLLLALAELLRGHAVAAHRHLAQVERDSTPAMRRLRALLHAARTIYRIELGQAAPAALDGALERLRDEQFAGFARLIEAAPFPGRAEGGYSALTSAEREILDLLAAGSSTKEIAATTGRSPRTVDTHIRSLCQKLNCNGRRAAVALATGSGWVQR